MGRIIRSEKLESFLPQDREVRVRALDRVFKAFTQNVPARRWGSLEDIVRWQYWQYVVFL